MNSRERLLIAFNHREPDRVPIDLGGTPASAISAAALDGLKGRLGISSPTRLMSPLFLNACPDDPVIQRLGVDVKMVASHPPAGFQADARPGGRMVDEWGVVHRSREQARRHIGEEEAPLHRIASPQEIERYPWPDPSDPSRVRGLKESARRFRREGLGVVVNTPLTVVTLARAMRGPGQFMIDTRRSRSLLEYLMDKILDIAMEMSRRLLEEVEEYADVVVFGDDLTGQDSLCSPDVYRQLFRPRHRAIMRFLKEHAGEAKILYPYGRAAEPILQDLVELGVEACNPAQVSGRRMDGTRRLKARYGRDLTFWGGIDTERVLSAGTPEEVKAEVRRRIEDLAPGGGFVLAPAHHIRSGVKPENLEAFYEAAREYGTYPVNSPSSLKNEKQAAPF